MDMELSLIGPGYLCRVYYGTPGFTENNDQNSPELDSQLQNVTLRDLTEDIDTIGIIVDTIEIDSVIYIDTTYVTDTTFLLIGPYVRITDIYSPYDPEYSSPDGNFNYNRSDNAFEAVMAYYHIDTYQRYLQSIGFSYHDDQIDVDPHGFYEDQSMYDANLDAILLGEGGVDDAEDADVIIHEYGHAIEHSAMGGFNYSWDESGALSEGYSDYLAGSYSASINTNQMNWVFNWDGHNEFGMEEY